jgi:hypothetical protein
MYYVGAPRRTRDCSFLRTLTSLTSLTVYSGRYSDPIEGDVLARLTALQRLKAFSWTGCSANLMTDREELRELGWSHHSAPLPSLPRELTSLSVRADIDGTPYTGDMDALTWFPAEILRSLTVLVQHTCLSRTDGYIPAFLTRLPEFTSLTKLCLSYSSDEDDQTADGALRAVAKLPKLVSLYLDADGPNFRIPPDLNQLSLMTNLTSLAFRSEGMTDFSMLASLVKLELLYLQPLSLDNDIFMHPMPDDPVPEPVRNLPAYLPPLPALRELRMELPRLPLCMRLYLPDA